ncbi:MAG: formate dehydrogenase subunit gamma [Gaiellaceae bacterium]|jgi:formate dehydrogenase subunit gamma|nr:formate dehydrogenase subunit gamma [Gaiellaceae bacterium]
MAPEYIERFSATERAVHWVHATAFLVLLATGLALYIPALSVAVGRRPLLKDIHVYTAVAWIVALVLVVALGDRRRLRQTLRDLDSFDTDDMLWLRRFPRPQGRFNAGQKVNAALTGAFAVLFAVSGSLLWLGERDHRFQLASTILLHDWLTLISLVLLVGHLYLALIYPATRHSLRGMTTGSVRRDWAERHHPKWVREQRQ